MASRRVTLGGIAGLAAVIAVLVTGCGGSFSATGTTGPVSSQPAAGSPSSRERGSKGNAEATAPSGAGTDRDGGGKKHPPLELPSGKPEQGFTRKQRERALTADIELKLPDGLTTANTCSSENVSPAISWRHVPPGASELVLFAMNAAPVNGKLYFDWALAGIDPSLERLEAGEVPAGAVLGRNSAGEEKYSLCPQGSAAETYIFALYAVEDELSPKPGFDPLALRKRATKASEQIGLIASRVGP